MVERIFLRGLEKTLAALPGKAPGAPQTRDTALNTVRGAFNAERSGIRARFESKGNALQLARDLTGLTDRLIVLLFDFALMREQVNPQLHGHMSVLAVGGYGRRELFPCSDIDILFLFDDPAAAEALAPVAEFILYALWDLGLKVGQAHRGIDDTLAQAQEDMVIRTNLLDARFICGSQRLFDAFSRRFREEVMKGTGLQFVEAKLEERDRRHMRCGGSRYLLEPNIKEGKGGLRDLHTLYWLAKYHYPVAALADLVGLGLLTAEEYRLFSQAQRFLWAVRAHLHYCAGRAEERLTFDRQQELAGKMGFRDRQGNRAVERFMKRYYLAARDVGNLTRIVCALLEEEKKRKPRMPLGQWLKKPERIGRFTVEGERLQFHGEQDLVDDPALMLALFHAAQEQELDIHPRALQLVGRHLRLINRDLQKDPRANRIFLDILLSGHGPETTLRRMNEAGVLGRFLPDFGRIIGQMQFDRYHVYTVDEHTIIALGTLHGIATGRYAEEFPLASELIHRVQSRAALYLGVLCHDIAKGRGGNHPELGAKIARKLGLRLGMAAQDAETAAWLVRRHLLFSDTAFKRDIDDPQTIGDLIVHVQSPERLRLLFLLTVVDIRAVGPALWNAWKGTLMRELYWKAERALIGSSPGGEHRAANTLARELAPLLPDWSGDAVQRYLALGTPAFLASCDARTHARIARMTGERERLGLPLMVDTRVDARRAITEICIVTGDQHGLFSRIAGALSLCGANIAGARIFTLKDGTAVDFFLVQEEGRAFDKPEKLAKFSVLLEMILSERLNPAENLSRLRLPYPSRMDALEVKSEVAIENGASATHTVIEITARDRIGLLYRITDALAGQGLSIFSAHISTYGEQAVDVFYVKDIFGMKVTHEGKLKQVRAALTDILAAPLKHTAA